MDHLLKPLSYLENEVFLKISLIIERTDHKNDRKSKANILQLKKQSFVGIAFGDPKLLNILQIWLL